MTDLGGGAEKPEPPKRPAFTIRVPSPPTVSLRPDPDTKKAFTMGDAPFQVFHLKIRGFAYGTDDKGHAASLILSFAILCLILLTLIIGAMVERAWIAEVLKLLGNAFLIVAGIAVGKSVEKAKNDDD